MLARLKAGIPRNGVSRKVHRRLRQWRSDFYSDYKVCLFISDPVPEPLPAAESLLRAGEYLADITPELLERIELPPRKRNVLRLYLQWGCSACGILNESGKLLAFYCVSIDRPIPVFGGITLRPGATGYGFGGWVMPEERRRGLGFVVNLHLLQRFGEARRITAFVRADNFPSMRNWEKCGQHPRALIDCRKRFFRPWRHRVTLLSPGLREDDSIRLGEVVNLILNGPRRVWREDDFIMTGI